MIKKKKKKQAKQKKKKKKKKKTQIHTTRKYKPDTPTRQINTSPNPTDKTKQHMTTTARKQQKQ